jgi:beta-galactosidase/beta-glucuronidase
MMISHMEFKKRFLAFCLCISTLPALFAQESSWQPVQGKIASEWASQVNPAAPLPEYPRPQMQRSSWVNLNGLWKYALTTANATAPTAYHGNILVPFAIESSLSGVGKTVGKDSLLWYTRSFSVDRNRKNKRFLLHFGAVDWRTQVLINGREAGTHEGGFDPFYFDITPLLNKSDKQEITIRVWDPTDEGPQPRGKQVVKPEGIWYTPVTGIWQTVWMEAVPETYISSLKTVADIDQSFLKVQPLIANAKPNDRVRIDVISEGQIVASGETSAQKETSIKIDNPRLWSPSSPYLYRLNVQLMRNGKPVDKVQSYAAMRKSSVGTDEKGIKRMLINNEFLFQYGPLDQGWWPDGLYTAPTDEALKFDIVKTKEMGFNMIRKHIKVEPARWYYYCDSLGILVWQDMPSGDLGNKWNQRPGVIGLGNDKNRSAESEAYFRKEWNAIIDALHPFPSIVVWTPFNEAWGQFKTEEISEWTQRKDPTRLINSASGGNFTYVDHIIDIHHYPDPAMPHPELFGKKLALVLGEFGGLGLPVKNHVWQEKDNWGYQSFKTAGDLIQKYSLFMDSLQNFIGYGLSAAVYTQTTDVEVEINGLMTYDRKVIKNPAAKLKELHDKLYGVKVNIPQRNTGKR